MRPHLLVLLCLAAFSRLGMADDPMSPTNSPPTPAASPATPASPAAPTAPSAPPAAPTMTQSVPGTTLSTPATPPTDPAHFEIYLLVGQSNMAGRGYLSPEDRVADPHVLVLNKQDKWVSQGEPIHFDKGGNCGVGPGFTFGKLRAAQKPGVTIGLIPCAFGGTTLDQWNPDSTDTKLYPPDNLYNNAIRRTKIAMQSGTLKGILWHQGESDANNKDDSSYAQRLALLVARFRADLGAPDVPFIAGEIGYFTYKNHASEIVNQQIDTLPQLVPFCAVASAKDLTDRGDHLHFNTESQKKLAQRYLDAFTQLEGSGGSASPQ